MITMTGTLIWDTTVSGNPGWLIHSARLNDGAATIPCPDAYHTPEDAEPDDLHTLLVDTLRWEGWETEGLTLTSETSGAYNWQGTVARA